MTSTPEPGDEYARFLRDMGDQLEQAGHRRASQTRRRRRIAAGMMALGGVVAGAVLLIGGGEGRVDVIAQAEAALAPRGHVLRIATISHLEMRGGTRPEVTGSQAESLGWNKPRAAEEWSASGPTRWRIATTIPTSTRAGSITAAPIQCAYSNGSEETYNQAFLANELTVVPVSKGQDETSQESSCTAQVSGGLGTDPVTHIGSMLASGQLHFIGRATINGREVLRLTGSEPRPRPTSVSSGAAYPVEYDVEPETFAPVRVTVEKVGVDALGNAGTLTEITDVTAYERLPLDETTGALLHIQTTGHPLIRRQLNQYEQRLGRARAPSDETASRAARTASAHRVRRMGDRKP